MNPLVRDEAATYSEATEGEKFQEVPLAHLSIELGHFYMDELAKGPDRIRAQFQRVAPWVSAAMASAQIGGGTARVSTCLLVDDYFNNTTDPGAALTALLAMARECGITIDYIARESGCHIAEDVPLAELVAARLLPEPEPGDNGSRPSVRESGWLCNGSRSPGLDSDQAMRPELWGPPQEFGKRNHSIFLDVELWRETTAGRLWSCPFLAAVWQLLRLGALRSYGRPVAQPRPYSQDTEYPARWDDLPPVMQINPQAAPFAAFRTVSILPQSYLPIEHAVKVILDHLSLDRPVIDQVVNRASREGIVVSPALTKRVSYVFIEGS